MKERVEKALQVTYRTGSYGFTSGYLPPQGHSAPTVPEFAISQEEMQQLIKDLWTDNQALRAKIEGMEGGIQLNKMIMDAAEEKLRVAEEALEFYANEDNYIPSMLSYGRLINPRIWQERSKIAQQALSTIRKVI